MRRYGLLNGTRLSDIGPLVGDTPAEITRGQAHLAGRTGDVKEIWGTIPSSDFRTYDEPTLAAIVDTDAEQNEVIRQGVMRAADAAALEGLRATASPTEKAAIDALQTELAP